jgi:hypothetical protein
MPGDIIRTVIVNCDSVIAYFEGSFRNIVLIAYWLLSRRMSGRRSLIKLRRQSHRHPSRHLNSLERYSRSDTFSHRLIELVTTISC